MASDDYPGVKVGWQLLLRPKYYLSLGDTETNRLLALDAHGRLFLAWWTRAD